MVDKKNKKIVEKKEIIALSNLSFGYTSSLVLKDVNLRINQGDFLALIGANGAAKSTLLKLMVGILKAKEGRVEIFGQDIKKFKAWSKLGYVSQEASQVNKSFPATVEEVVASGLYKGFANYFSREEKKQKITEALEALGLTHLSKKLIGQLSGGQRQKVFVAKALVNKPEILFLDEPTTGIDAKSQEEFYRILVDLNENQGMTIVLVSHDVANIFDFAKSVACVREGTVYLHEDIDELTEEHIAETLGYRIGRKKRGGGDDDGNFSL